MLFEKFYPHEPWVATYTNFLTVLPQQVSGDYMRPLPPQITCLKVLEDIRAGLRPKSEPSADPKRKKKKVAKLPK